MVSVSDLTIGVLYGVASALGFALSAAGQHRTAAALPQDNPSLLRVLAWSLGKPLWCFAMILSGASLALHGLALAHAPIAVVQPLMMFGVVFAVPLRTMMDHRRPSATEARHVSMAAVGLTIFILSIDPSRTTTDVLGNSAPVVLLLGCAGAWLITRRADRMQHPNNATACLAIGAGILFGITAALLKAVSEALAAYGALAAISHWSIWLWAAAGLLGIAVNQRAYQRAALAVSLPMINVVNVAVAVALGLLLFGEIPAHDAGSLAVQVTGLAMSMHGITRLTATVPAPGVRMENRSSARSAT